jgi:hypothetical protein
MSSQYGLGVTHPKVSSYDMSHGPIPTEETVVDRVTGDNLGMT